MLLDSSEDIDKPYLGGERVSVIHIRIAARSVPAVNWRTMQHKNTAIRDAGCTAIRQHRADFFPPSHSPSSSQFLHGSEVLRQ